MRTGTVMEMLLLVPIVVPALAAGLAAVLGWRRWVAWSAVVGIGCRADRGRPGGRSDRRRLGNCRGHACYERTP